MHPDTVVTIGRQVGAGGLEVGRLLAETLGVPFYDRELLALAARRSGLSESVLEQHDEKPADNFLFAAFGAPSKGACVIVGRAADFVLDGRPHLVRVFLHADPAIRAARVAAREGVSEAEARKLVRTADRRRAAFYDYFTDRTWGDVRTYDLCLDAGRVTPEQAVAVIRAFADAAG